MFIRRKSAWTFNTSSTGGASLDIFAAGGGALKLADPKGKDVVLHYAAAGFGLGVGLKTPGNINGSLTPGSFPNAGAVYILDSFGGYDDLERSDLTGACLVFEAAGGIFGGASAAVMLLGLSHDRKPVLHLLMGLTMGLTGAVLGAVTGEFSGTALVVLGGATTYTGIGTDGLLGIVW
jgi:hypothetical protein